MDPMAMQQMYPGMGQMDPMAMQQMQAGMGQMDPSMQMMDPSMQMQAGMGQMDPMAMQQMQAGMGQMDPMAMQQMQAGMGQMDPSMQMYPPMATQMNAGMGQMDPMATQQGMYGAANNMGAPSIVGAQEMAHYQTLYNMVDTTGQGWVDASSTAAFLHLSGLPQQTLHTIWQIADSSGQGYLTPEQFCNALRLVAHAQAGHNLSPELVNMEPQMLPEFEGVQRQRAPSEISGPSIRSAPSVLQPVVSNETARVPRGRSPPRTFTRDRWVPSQREKRKYASLFLRTDYNGDGFVDSPEAMSLLERASLDRDTLMLVWEFADVDHDGRLSFVEFVALVHMITCIKRGAMLPQLQEGMPQELLYALQNMHESPHDLHAQRSQSPSRSPSPTLGDLWSHVPTTSTIQTTPAGWDTPGQTDPFPASGFGDTGGFGDNFGDFDKKDKKDKKRHKSPPSLDDFGTSSPRQPQPQSARSPRLTLDERARREEELRKQREREMVEAAMKQFTALIEADREVSNKVRREVSEMEGELRHVREAKDQVEQQVRQKQQELSRARDDGGRCEEQLDDAKQRLAEAREDRRGISMEGAAMVRNHQHFQEEIQFLNKLMDEEMRKLEECRRANEHLERSYLGLEAQTAELEKQRHGVIKEVAAEEANLRIELRQNAEMRTNIQRMWREQHSTHLGRQEQYLKEQRFRQMQGGDPAEMKAQGLEALSHPDDSKHSWAGRVSAPNDPRTAWVS